MSDASEHVVETVAALAALQGFELRPESRAVVAEHLDIAAKMAAYLMSFPLPDDAEPAPVFAP